jgi:D-3-phosphoglycerate dehydrogenase
VVAPHLGASTREAQDKAGATIAEMVELALAGEFVPFAVNVNAEAASETVRPFLPLAEKLGALFASLSGGAPPAIEIEYQGQIADYDTRILTLAVLKGFFGASTDEPVSYVNAPQLAADHGIEVRDTTTTTAQDYVNLVTIRGPQHAIAGTLSGLKGEARIVMVDDHTLDMPPAKNMLVVRNDDHPGVIGHVGSVLGAAGVNISDMAVGRSPEGSGALMVVSTSAPVDDDVLTSLKAADGITAVAVLARG